MYKMVLWILSYAVISLLGFGMVAFVTLLERKLLGLTQVRLGPNKVTLLGLLQPLADGVKLLTKQLVLMTSSQSILFFVSPSVLLGIFIFSWSLVLPLSGELVLMKYLSLFLFSMLGISAYGIMMSGWSVTSGFSKLGAMRGMLQSLSFEVALILVFLFSLVFLKSFFFKMESAVMETLLLWSLLWVIISLMESNRAPFDLLEGESELISGFNVEMGSSMFVLLFLSEYGMLGVMAIITDVILMSKITGLSIFIISMMLFVRSCFPRIRYDSLMSLMWQTILPISALLFLMAFLLF